MYGYLLKNKNGEYLKTLDTANSKIDFTTNVNEARNYAGRPGGGAWDAENEFQFIKYYFGKEYGDKVNTLKCVYEEWDNPPLVLI